MNPAPPQGPASDSHAVPATAMELGGPMRTTGLRGEELPNTTQQNRTPIHACSLGLLHNYYYQLGASQVPDTGLDTVFNCTLQPTEVRTIDSILQRRSLRADSGSVCPRSHSQGVTGMGLQL